MRFQLQRIATAVCATVLVLGGTATPSPAVAATAPYVDTVTGGPITVRVAPFSSKTTAVGQIADNTSVTIKCQVRGQTVTGKFGTSSLWNKLSSPKVGYVSDTNVYTGHSGQYLTTCPSDITNDYPYPSSSWNDPDPWNFYKRECVSFAAYRIRTRLGLSFHNYYKNVHWGNANNWDNAARAVGITVNQTPTIGAIAQWEGTKGHVAWVSRVNSDGSIRVEEYNKGGTHLYQTRTVYPAQQEDFIHFR